MNDLEKDAHPSGRLSSVPPASDAWSAPLIPLTVATPRVAADAPPPADAPTVFVTGTMPLLQTAAARIATLVDGAVVFAASGARGGTGVLRLEATSTAVFSLHFDDGAFADAGWILRTRDGGLVVFEAPALGAGQSRRVPTLTWSGSRTARGTVAVSVRTADPAIAGVGTSAVFR